MTVGIRVGCGGGSVGCGPTPAATVDVADWVYRHTATTDEMLLSGAISMPPDGAPRATRKRKEVAKPGAGEMKVAARGKTVRAVRRKTAS